MACKCKRCDTLFLDNATERMSPQCPICLVSHYEPIEDTPWLSSRVKKSQASRQVRNGFVYERKGGTWLLLCTVWGGTDDDCHAGDSVITSRQVVQREVDPSGLDVLDETDGPDGSTEVLMSWVPSLLYKPTSEAVLAYLTEETEGASVRVEIQRVDHRNKTVLASVWWAEFDAFGDPTVAAETLTAASRR